LKILFVHQNFPGQFKYLAPALAADKTNTVVALTMMREVPRQWNGVRLVSYGAARSSSRNVHPWLADLETKVIRGEASLHAALHLKADGFTPDVIIVHPGWGEGLFLKEVWPTARLGMYCELFYQSVGADVGFDPEFAVPDAHDESRIRIKNVNNLLHMQVADGKLAPTRWQASTFPASFHSRIAVVHDGIDTRRVAPRNDVSMLLKTAHGKVTLTRADEVVTFVSRNLEPYRGCHTFLRALPQILLRRPKARIVIAGGKGVSYGPAPSDGRTWKDVFMAEVRPRISDADWRRVHFVGKLAYPQFISLLQLSTVHVYLTYPFVLSWSLLEAMSAGCSIIASDTAPVREVIEHDITGRLVDFFDADALAAEVCELLADAPTKSRLSTAAREFATAHYDLRTVCLPQQLSWVRSLANGSHTGPNRSGKHQTRGLVASVTAASACRAGSVPSTTVQAPSAFLRL
jgi:glycosyltransferase involved in cell wall biosynthesis